MKKPPKIPSKVVALLLLVTGLTFVYGDIKTSDDGPIIAKPSPLNFHLVNEAKQSIAPQVAAGEKRSLSHMVVESKDPDFGVDGYFLLARSPDFPGNYISNAWAALGSTGNWSVMVEFSSEGTKKFSQLTGKNVGKRLAIVLNGVVLSAPRINGAISGGTEITGAFTESEARALVASLKRHRITKDNN